MRKSYGNWYLLTGLVIGFFIGLAVAWIFQPVEYIDTSPASLRSAYKDQYRLLIAASYAASGDLVRAKARLELLEDENTLQALTEQAQRTLAEGSSPEAARQLGLLALALGQSFPGSAGAVTQPPISTGQFPAVTPSFETTVTITPP